MARRPNASAGPVRLNAGTAAPLVTGEVREGIQSDYESAVTAAQELQKAGVVADGPQLAALVGYGGQQLLDQLRNASPPPPGNEEQRDAGDGRTPSGHGYTPTKTMGLIALSWDWIKLNPLKAVAGAAVLAGVVWYLRRGK